MLDKSRNFGLDIIRAISISLVVLSHMFMFTNIELGVWGVEVFFVLSGFLIGQILIRDFSDGITLKKVVRFWKRRWFRTLPLYYAVVLIKFIFFDSSLGYKIFAYIFFLQNNFVGINFLAVSWSLVVEEWFYLLFPISLFVFFRNGLGKREFLIFLIVFIFSVLAIRIFWVINTNRSFDAIRPNFPFRFDTLVYGVLLAHIKLNYHFIYKKISSFFVCLLGVVLMVYLAFSLGRISALPDSKELVSIWYRTGWFSAIAFSIFLIIPFFETSPFIERTRKYRALYWIITWTSVLTYSIYLIHMFVFQIPLPINLLGFDKIIHVFLLYIFSYLAYKYFEHPMTELRDKKIKLFSK